MRGKERVEHKPALTKGEVMVGGQVGTRSLDFSISQKLEKQLLKLRVLCASLGDPHLHAKNSKKSC